MCGICGVAGGAREHERDAVARMMASIVHRGPDDGGRYEDEGAVLGNRRLAIIDVTRAGKQPLGTADGRFWITFNGEIYNYREIRRQLEHAGVRFRTGTDTEVLLELYRRKGRACL
jgi:asparagine synthase (glutamine-hydrolysing)